jgi:hypothetical protein
MTFRVKVVTYYKNNIAFITRALPIIRCLLFIKGRYTKTCGRYPMKQWWDETERQYDTSFSNKLISKLIT